VGEQGTSALGFESRALLAHPDEVALRRFRRAFAKAGTIPGASAHRRLVIDTAVRSVVAAAMLVPVLILAVAAFSAPFEPGAFGLLPIVAALVGFAIWYLARPLPARWRAIRPWRRWYRLNGFAEDNGLVYLPHLDTGLDGLMFRQGTQRRVTDMLGTRDASFVIGTFHFVAGDNMRTLGRDPAFSFLRVKLPRPVPHLVLISTARRRFHGYSSVGLSFAESQRVRLEGDFDRTFSAYAPDGYGADARYVLTPDLMARLVDNASTFDLEFVDDALYVYSATAWDVESPATWVWARRFAEAVGVPALRRTARFADDRSVEPGTTVAPAGRRLRVAVPVVAGVIAAAWIIYNLAQLILRVAP
jgi:hypothetical protein